VLFQCSHSMNIRGPEVLGVVSPRALLELGHVLENRQWYVPRQRAQERPVEAARVACLVQHVCCQSCPLPPAYVCVWCVV
jgi:hypothetical protein